MQGWSVYKEGISLVLSFMRLFRYEWIIEVVFHSNTFFFGLNSKPHRIYSQQTLHILELTGFGLYENPSKADGSVKTFPSNVGVTAGISAKNSRSTFSTSSALFTLGLNGGITCFLYSFSQSISLNQGC